MTNFYDWQNQPIVSSLAVVSFERRLQTKTRTFVTHILKQLVLKLRRIYVEIFCQPFNLRY
jgi:hypothetical protein